MTRSHEKKIRDGISDAMGHRLAQMKFEIRLFISQNDLIHEKYVRLMKNSPFNKNLNLLMIIFQGYLFQIFYSSVSN